MTSFCVCRAGGSILQSHVHAYTSIKIRLYPMQNSYGNLILKHDTVKDTQGRLSNLRTKFQ